MIEQQLAALRQQIGRVERPFTHPVEIIPVTKGFDDSAIEAAAAAGCTTVGENYAQDLLSKAGTIRRLGIDVQFIGQLQSNKVRQLIDVVTVWASVDRRSIVDEIAKRVPGARILIQVNATGEAGKGGCSPQDVADLIGHAVDSGLHVEGLMTVGPTGLPPEAAQPAFRAVRELVDVHGLEVCSMGMSGDLEIAVACGATQVRVGSALFGPRPSRN